MPRRGDGITDTPSGGFRVRWRERQTDGTWKQRTKRFPKHTTKTAIKTFRKAQEGLHALSLTNEDKTPTVPGAFRAHVRSYLEAVKSMATYRERKAHLDEWAAIFGDRSRKSIRADEIDAQLHRWRAGGMAASTVNHRRTALQHMYTVLDGKSGRNPVRDTTRFAEPDPEPRDVRPEVLSAVLHSMGDTDSHARLLVMATTGLPGSSIGRIDPAYIDWDAPSVFVPGRRKGKGTRGRMMPLTVEGKSAFEAMKRRGCWGPFSKSSLWKAFRRGCDEALKQNRLKPADVAGLRPYDLRHAFGTAVYRATGDIRSTQVLMGHSSPVLTHRYTLAAVEPRVAAALGKLPRMVPPLVPPEAES
jgi:integrase